MPYEDEELENTDLGPEMNALTGAVIGACIEMHRQLGAGLDESNYEEALRIELDLRKIPFVRQPIVSVGYKGHVVGQRRLDFIIDGKLVHELKAVEELAPVHTAQVLTYLKITQLKLGLLVNFNTAVLKNGIKRIIRT